MGSPLSCYRDERNMNGLPFARKRERRDEVVERRGGGVVETRKKKGADGSAERNVKQP